MFGNVAAFVNGNMFMGLFGDDIGVKLPAEQLESLLSKPGAGPFGPPERPMGAYAALPPDVSTRSARSWIGKSLEYVGSMPPKKPKKSAKKAAKKGAGSGRRAGGQR